MINVLGGGMFMDDELLSSWLLRQRSNKPSLGGNSIAYEIFLKSIFSDIACRSLDVDRHCTEEIVSAIKTYFGDIDFSTLMTRFESGGWLLNGVFQRSAFCPLCIRE